MDIVKQRTDSDCMAACLAMLLGVSYEEAHQYFPSLAMQKYGYIWEPVVKLVNLAEENDAWIRYIEDKEELKELDFDKPLILEVPSLNHKGGRHVIFWDGDKVMDPCLEKTYRTLPGDIFSAVINEQ